MQATAILSLIVAIFMFANVSKAKEVQVIEIRKNLQLSNNEAVYSDYYLNAGNDLGIKPGTTFVLYRRVNVIDRLGTNQGRALALPVGKIKIIYVAKDLSVARVEKLEENKSTPILEHRGVMLGDLINVGSAEIAEEGDKSASNYGPQGLNVSFEATSVVAPMLPTREESRMPATVNAVPTIPQELPTKPSKNNVESIKSSINPIETEQVPLIR
ncbi:MAG: hypothetical protein V4596_14270 [Bdellovibrionota bacterium]